MELGPQWDRWPSNVEMVPTEELWRLREYDRRSEPHHSPMDPYNSSSPEDYYSRLREDIAQRGIQSPGIIKYGQHDRRAILGEGNHRLAVARELGIPEMPARVWRLNMPLGQGVRVPGATPNAHDYIPADLRPSQIGLPGWRP